MIWAMQPFHILKSVLTSNGWQMAKFLKQVTDTPQEALLGTDCKHAPTTCTCFLTQNAHNCTITRATCTLGNPEYQRQLQQQETNTLSPTREQDCSEKPFLCICGEPFPTAFALNLHIAGAPPGRGHDWTPESRPILGFNIIIFDPNHPNPFKGMVMAFSERVHMSVHTAVALCASLDFLQNTQNSQNSGGFRVYGSTALNPKPVFEVLCLRLCR